MLTGEFADAIQAGEVVRYRKDNGGIEVTYSIQQNGSVFAKKRLLIEDKWVDAGWSKVMLTERVGGFDMAEFLAEVDEMLTEAGYVRVDG